jgi:hypothetical protein
LTGDLTRARSEDREQLDARLDSFVAADTLVRIAEHTRAGATVQADRAESMAAA